MGLDPAVELMWISYSFLVMVLVTALVLMNAKPSYASPLLVLPALSSYLVYSCRIFHLNPGNWGNFAPYGFGEIYVLKQDYGWRFAHVLCLSLVLSPFQWRSMQVKEPQKNVPRGIVLSL